MITITAAASLNLSGRSDSRVVGRGSYDIIPNICRIEARYQYRDGSSGAWGDTGAWQTVAWRLWDTHNPGTTLSGRSFNNTYYTPVAADGQQYRGRSIQARLPIAADGSFNGVTRQYRVQARLVYGDGQVFNDFLNNRPNPPLGNLSDLLNQTLGSERLAYNPACDKVSVDSAARAGNWTTGPSIAPGSITPELSARHTQGGANSPLRWFGLPNAARIVAKPGITLNAPPGTDTADIGIEYAAVSTCTSSSIHSCTTITPIPPWLSIQDTGSFDVITIPAIDVTPTRRQLRLRFANSYGWGQPTAAGVPFQYPSRTPQTPEGNKLLNLVERGLVTFYPKSAGTAATAVWQYGEGVFLDGVVDYPPPYDDLSIRSDLGYGAGVYIHQQGFGGVPVTATGSVVSHYRPTELITDLVAVTGINTHSTGYAAQIALGNSSGWAISSVTNEASNKLLVYRPCQYEPGQKWDRYVVQTNTVTNWRLRGWYACAPPPASNQPNIVPSPRERKQVGQRPDVTSYAGNGIRITDSRLYTLTARVGDASIYNGRGEVIIHSNGNDRSAPFFLNTGTYDILADRGRGSNFDISLEEIESFAPTSPLVGVSEVSVLGAENTNIGVDPTVIGAEWRAIPSATGYEYEYTYTIPGRRYTGGGNSDTSAAKFIIDKAATSVTLRVRGYSLNPATGGYSFSLWSETKSASIAPLSTTSEAQPTPPPAVRTADSESAPNPVGAVVANVLAELNITGAANAAAAPVISVVLCGLIAGIFFVSVFLVSGGGTASAFAGLLVALLFWMGVGPIFFGLAIYVAVAPAALVLVLAAMVMIRRFGF